MSVSVFLLLITSSHISFGIVRYPSAGSECTACCNEDDWVRRRGIWPIPSGRKVRVRVRLQRVWILCRRFVIYSWP